ncbi:sensor histidine kinase [Nocardioides oleivorans]|uniref:histidine kinase n=1 Tax=Nocardioides oleivorans TaxID=273676 RepID=A0A4Q2RNU3_9ACTN|nr:sensor histidine kinase [Nocardioides oleivorans]RYB90560.1 sensor histidine kinase [Nocardioides oleivorans]
MRLALDSALAAVCLAVTLVIHLGGSEAVEANRAPDALTVLLTVVAVGSIALRRRYPLAVVVTSLAGVLGLVLVRGAVGTATIGPMIAAYTAVAWGTSSHARQSVGVVVAALLLTGVMDPVDLSPAGALLNGAAFAGVVLLGTTSRARRERADAAVQTAEQRVTVERERANAERERSARAATEERLRITRELHDVLGHAMSVMVVQAGAAGRLLDADDAVRARTAVAEIERTGRRSMAEMRQLLGVLRDDEPGDGASPRSPAPTLTDMAALARRVGEAGLPTTLTVSGDPDAVPAGVGLAAYRIVQEALTNSLKHSGAGSATVAVSCEPSGLRIEVADDGHGTREGRPTGQGGHGLAGMRERVAIYGGDLVLDSSSAGFRVRATFPAAEPA